MSSRSQATLKEPPESRYRDRAALRHDSQPTQPSSLIDRRCIDPSFDDSISDPIAYGYGMDDVIKHLRSACGQGDSANPIVANKIKNLRKEDDHE